MCLVVVAHAAATRYRFVMAANRDELHTRPARPAGWWPEPPGLFGGRDLLAGGTWLGVDRRGRVAAVTNVRDGTPREAPRSRGALVTGYLGSAESAAGFSALSAAAGASFAAFNLLLLDGAELWFASNRAATTRLAHGIHALSNAPFGVEWPKTVSAKDGAARALAAPDPLEALFELLAVRSSAESAEERYREAHFVVGPVYGTRCSTVILIDDRGMLTFAERSFDVGGAGTGDVRESFATES
ncbi:MAG: NRDE family protein [Gammaproteobacteria bacterium]